MKMPLLMLKTRFPPAFPHWRLASAVLGAGARAVKTWPLVSPPATLR